MNSLYHCVLVVAISCVCTLTGLAQGVNVTIGGRITQKQSGSPLVGATVTFTPGNLVAVTDTNGVYTQSVVSGWSGTATPTYASAGKFSPAASRYNRITRDRTKNYTWKAAEVPAIEGRVRLSDSDRPLAGVVITFSGLGSVTTDAEGHYRYEVPLNWSGTASAELAGSGSFSPKTRKYTKVKKLRPEQGYVWHAPDLLTTTGTVVWYGTNATAVLTVPDLLTVSTGGADLLYPVTAPDNAQMTTTVNETALQAVCGGNPTGLVLIVVHGGEGGATVEAQVADTTVHGQAKLTAGDGQTTLVWDLTLTAP